MSKVLATPIKIMIIKNIIEQNLASSSCTRCITVRGKYRNLFNIRNPLLNTTKRLFSNLRRVVPFYSLIKLSFDHIVGSTGAKVINIYVRVFSSMFSPFTTKSDKPINAAKILISFPLLWFTLSTNMVNKMFAHNIEVTLPIYTWGLLDRYFIRVERENFGNGPGLYGNIISYNGTDTFYTYVKQLFTEEFLFNCLSGTDFEGLVTIRKDKQGEDYYHVDNNLQIAINSRLKPFDHQPYSFDFMVSVSTFYSDFSSKFKNKHLTVSKLPDRRINIEAGLHCIRNHEISNCYVYHKSVDMKFENQFFFNSFVILSLLFNVEYYAASDSDMSNLRFYGDGIPGNNEMYIDLTSVKLEDVLKTLFSAGLLTHVGNVDNRQPNTPLRSLEVPFGGIRQYSTIANSRLSTLSGKGLVPDGSYFYSVPISTFGYAKVDLGDGRFMIVDTS